MRIRERKEEEPQFQMAPMIDMVFLLLVFFMMASHLSQKQNIKLDMPTAEAGVVPKERPDRYVVNITTNGMLFSGMNPIELEDLGDTVKNQLLENPSMKIYLRADRNAPYREVRKVMMAMANAGIDDFIFGVFTPGSGGAEGP